MRGKILTVGDSTVDRFLAVEDADAELICRKNSKNCELCFSYGEKIPLKSVMTSFGGSALNCAIGFAKLDLNCSLATFVGRDSEGYEMLDFVKRQGVGINHVRKDEYTNQSNIILYNGERTVLSYHQPRKYEQTKLDGASWIYLASAGKGIEKVVPLIREKIKSGSYLIFNPGSWELKNFEKFSSLLPQTAILILNRQEARLVIANTDNVKNQLSKMIELGAKIAVITDGANGAYFGCSGNFIHLNTLATRIVDSTGAGDAFASAFCAGLLQRQTVEESAKWGMINSASVIESVGANAGLLDTEKIKSRARLNKILKFKPI